VAGWKDKLGVMRRYDLTADMYDERYGEEQGAKYRAALENVKLQAGVVLDVGCGSGLFFGYVAPFVDSVVGVDISRKLLVKANVEAKRFCNVFVLQADADHLPFSDGFFEAVFAFTMLQNMPAPRETLLEIGRATGADGLVVVTGLKKVFPLNRFLEILGCPAFRGLSIVDSEDLKCYIAVFSKS